MKIFLVRHAETYGNLGIINPSEGPQHIKLSPKGQQDAKLLVKKIKNPGKIIVSKYYRTHQTAEHVIDKNSHIDVLVYPHLHEFTYISLEKFAHPKTNINKVIKDYWENLDPFYDDGGNAESFAKFVERIHTTILKLKKEKVKGDIYAFSHAGFIKAFLLLNKEFKNLFQNKNNKKNFKKNMKTFMQRFYETGQTKEITISNCEIIDVTQFIKKYK